MIIGKLIAFSMLSSIKIFSHVFYKNVLKFTPEKSGNYYKDTRMIVFMNHTSLYEPLFCSALSYSFLWRLAFNNSVPGADITLSRPIVGFFWKLLMPKITSITRKKDESWDYYLNSIGPKDIIMFAPEGRMKRPTGLDKAGKKMTVRAGIADIIEKLPDGNMVLAMSGGLHHVQAPGQFFPKIFKTISMNLVRVDIKEYKAQFTGSPREIKFKMVEDLQRRLETDCPPEPAPDSQTHH